MKILVASNIDKAALHALQRDHDVAAAVNASEERLSEAAAECEVLIFRSGVQVSSAVMSAAPKLRLMIRAGSGLDNVDVAHARSTGIRLVRVPGSSAQPVAEMTFALLLAVARNVCRADSLLRAGHWPKSELGGPLLQGKTLGVVGAGNIGSRVGEMADAWGMRVLGCVANPAAVVADALGARGIELTDFDKVLESADFLSLHVPLDATTRHMIGTAELARMKSGAVLVNMARGGVLDEAALLADLMGGDGLGGAALDVHEHEGEGTISALGALPNVVLTPHIGAMASDSQRLIGERVRELVEAFAAGKLNETAQDIEVVA